MFLPSVASSAPRRISRMIFSKGLGSSGKPLRLARGPMRGLTSPRSMRTTGRMTTPSMPPL
jgi:hypothetical protein